jgi:hypothetical protein
MNKKMEDMKNEMKSSSDNMNIRMDELKELLKNT